MFFFFKAVFESFAGGLDFSVTILISKLNIQSHRKQMFMPHKWRQKEQKKRHCIFTSRSLGPLFSRSPHSLHTRVSHGSVFLWSDMISKLLILLLQFKYLSVCKYISLIILTRLIGSGPLRLELEASLLLSICVINYIFFTKICHVKTVFVSVCESIFLLLNWKQCFSFFFFKKKKIFTAIFFLGSCTAAKPFPFTFYSLLDMSRLYFSTCVVTLTHKDVPILTSSS